MEYQLGLRIKQGDERSFEEFFRMNYSDLCAFSNKYLQNPEKSKNVVQDAFSEIWEGRANINPKDSLKSHLFKITTNLCLSLLQREKDSRYTDIYRFIYIENSDAKQDYFFTEGLDERIPNSLDKVQLDCH